MNSKVYCEVPTCTNQAAAYWVWIDSSDSMGVIFSRCNRHAQSFYGAGWSAHSTYEAAQLHIAKESL